MSLSTTYVVVTPPRQVCLHKAISLWDRSAWCWSPLGYLHTAYLSCEDPKPPLDSRLGAVRPRARSELDLLILFQPVPSLQGDRHDTGFLLNKSGRREHSAQTAKRPIGVHGAFKEIPLEPFPSCCRAKEGENTTLLCFWISHWLIQHIGQVTWQGINLSVNLNLQGKYRWLI